MNPPPFDTPPVKPSGQGSLSINVGGVTEFLDILEMTLGLMTSYGKKKPSSSEGSTVWDYNKGPYTEAACRVHKQL